METVVLPVLVAWDVFRLVLDLSRHLGRHLYDGAFGDPLSMSATDCGGDAVPIGDAPCHCRCLTAKGILHVILHAGHPACSWILASVPLSAFPATGDGLWEGRACPYPHLPWFLGGA